jgi:4-hydroxybenzoate polyprenyltransferase
MASTSRRHAPMNPAAHSSIRVWFDLARAGNFPSVASNVLAALVLSSGHSGFPPAGPLLLAIIAGCLAYAGGATLNDVADAKFDARHRPERAIPRQLVSRAAASWAGGVQLALGLGLLVALGASPLLVGALAAAILVYDWIHKRWAGSVVLMAGCRVLLALALASLPGHSATPAFLVWIGALFVYIVALSLIARREYHVRDGSPAAAAAYDTARARAARTPDLGKHVGRLLAFIPLVDATALLIFGAWLPAVACAAAVPLGRWAQRLAAST